MTPPAYESASKVVRRPEFDRWLARNRDKLTGTPATLDGDPATLYRDAAGRVAALSCPGAPGVYHIYAGEVVE